MKGAVCCSGSVSSLNKGINQLFFIWLEIKSTKYLELLVFQTLICFFLLKFLSLLFLEEAEWLKIGNC